MGEHYAIIGHPVGHSLSPAMQAAAFRAAGVQATYESIDVPPGTVARWLCEAGATLGGFNVTIPHKQAIPALVNEMSPEARETGVVNTVVREGTRLVGHNTDVEGFERALSTFGDLESGDALVFGAGGAARAVVTVLRRRGYRVWVAARSRDQAMTIAAGDRILDLGGGPAGRRAASADILVNSTPLGMTSFPDQSPLPDGAIPRAGSVAIDLVYGRATPFLRAARRAGCRTQDGLEMLVYQGAAAFRLWTGREPDIDVMRNACLARLAEATCSAS